MPDAAENALPALPPSLSPETLAEAFNSFATAAQEDYPRLKNEFIVLDADTRQAYGYFDNKTKYPDASDEDVAADLGLHASKAKEIGSHASHIAFSQTGFTLEAGALITFTRNESTETLFGRAHPQLYLMMYTLYHELGHVVVRDSMHSDRNTDNGNFSETAADVYALIRMRQKFPEEEKGFFFNSIRFIRGIGIAEHGHEYSSHYTGFGIDELERVSKKIDLEKITPEQTAELAWNIAARHSLSATAQFRIAENFQEYRETRQQDMAGAMQKLAERVLTSDNITFQAGMHFLTPFLEGKAQYPDAGFDAPFWGDMRVKLQARQKELAEDGLTAGLPAAARISPQQP